jgi:potassium-transporting ATPase potassium-binding subunit
MSDTAAGILQVGLLVVALAVAYRPLGAYMANVYTSDRHYRVERAAYRTMGVHPDADQRWTVYARSVLAFSVVSVLVLYTILRVQAHLPWSLGFSAMPPAQAWNTATSFVTNTNWQSYSGEAALGYFAQMAGLAVQNFASAAVGMAVAIAVIRGFMRSQTDAVGNFWVDLVRGCFRILLPIAIVGAIALIAMGAVQNLADNHTITTLTGHQQTITGGPVASQEAIKELGTNGGGFYNANSAHPFENPNNFSNLLEIFLLLVIPVSLTRTFGLMVKDKRQGYAILAAMGVIWLVLVASVSTLEAQHPGTALNDAGASMEGKETRYGTNASALFAVSTTGTSTGAVDSFHDSYTAVGGGLLIFNIGLGEVAPGGVGSGLYGLLALAIVTVFVAGLMVGRTPEYIRKKITTREIKLVSLYILIMPVIVLAGTGLAMSLDGPKESILNPGAHGLSEVMYAFMSAGNNNGSAFAGLSVNTDFYNVALGFMMLLGRFIPIVIVLALAGSLARQRPVPETAGTMPTHGGLFVSMLVGVMVIVAGLTFFPALALGPLAEGLA